MSPSSDDFEQPLHRAKGGARDGHNREEDTPVRRAFGGHGRWPSQGVASRLGYVKTVVVASKRCTLDSRGWEVGHCSWENCIVIDINLGHF